ncbi:MAG: peptide ABC transporter substrate-binding protein [Verrucomicrobiota bacterium]|nr:peptide ABC transporter substrate-binding protein [Verrucomicrobiota bacterium]
MRLCFALALAILAGCGRALDRADLVFLNGAEPETLDPALITGQLEGRIAYALFEGLASFDQTGTARPGVAERWDISADGRVYTFHLRKEAKWSNGEPVTSVDFLQSWQRTLQPATAAEYAYQLHYVVNARAYNEGKLTDFTQVGLRAPDPHTFEVTLENPTPFFIDLCAFATLLPVHMPSVRRWEERGESFTKPGRLIGNGAFVLTEWRLFDRIRVRKNPHYWNYNNVGMQSIDILPAARPMTAFNFYATGAADLMMDKGLAPTPLMEELKKRPDFHSAPFLGNYFLRFNVTRKPFDDVRVRMAFSIVIDKELIVTKITKAGELPADSLTPPDTAGYYPPPGPRRDVARAKQLLAEAGYPGGKGFPIVYYLYKGDSDLDRDIAVELQGMFGEHLGVQIQLRPQEWKVYLNSLSQLDYDLCRSSWVGDYKDPNTFLDMFVTGGGNNRTGWSSPRYDELIAAAGVELDREKRFAIFQEAEKILISNEAPICPLYYYVGIQFYDASRLGGIEANLTDEHPLKSMFWKRR